VLAALIRRLPRTQRPAANDAVRAEHALEQVGNVHRAARAPARPGGFAENLGHHALDVDALGDAVAVPAVGRRDGVAVVEVTAHSGGRGLVTEVDRDFVDPMPGIPRAVVLRGGGLQVVGPWRAEPRAGGSEAYRDVTSKTSTLSPVCTDELADAGFLTPATRDGGQRLQRRRRGK
jgi:hypothetical protein